MGMVQMAGRIAGVIALLASTVVVAFGRPGATGSISGIVTEAGGRGAARLAVSASPGDQTATTDEDGRFVLPGLKAGVYLVTVARGSDVLGSKMNVTVRPGDSSRVAFEVPSVSFLQRHSRLLILIASGVLVILGSVAVKYALAGRPA